ncbi:Rust resistance kinase Lr10 [Vitis vinifera]|uniref:Rust resistance kinase Lr10 n=1 Tax=Vitis vinifera TaxID=29760 RepID=A0A438HSV8_VITVI|nr:Rust resistance kinase Lr10 [Vitis vinifera]
MRGGRDECMASNRCGDQGPLIQFPFRLKDQPCHCGYPGFELSCTENNQTMLELPVSSIPCLSIPGNLVYAVDSSTFVHGLDLSYCRRLYNASAPDKLGEGGYGTVYKGKLSDEVFVAVKILNNSQGNGEEFINEVATMGTIHHVNIVRLVGFCVDRFKRALIYEYLPNESLEKFIFSKVVKNYSLSWKKLQEIAIGIAKGIEYLHQGCDQRILHFDIKPHNILLDHNFNPKISDFGLAKLCSKEQSAVSMTIVRGTMGYIAPEVLSRNFGNVSYKSDVYSFGMLLLEMVGGRKNIDVSVESTSQVYFPEWIYNHLDIGEELHIRIEEEGDVEIAKKLAIVGLSCIQWCPVDRPSMKIVVQMLEGEGDKLTMPPNPFASTVPTNLSKPGRVFQQELAIISELE